MEEWQRSWKVRTLLKLSNINDNDVDLESEEG